MGSVVAGGARPTERSEGLQVAVDGVAKMIARLAKEDAVRPEGSFFRNQGKPYVESGRFTLPGKTVEEECLVLVLGNVHGSLVREFLELGVTDFYRGSDSALGLSHETMNPLQGFSEDFIFQTNLQHNRYETALVLPLSVLSEKGLDEKLRDPDALMDARVQTAQKGYRCIYELAKQMIRQDLLVADTYGGLGTDPSVARWHITVKCPDGSSAISEKVFADFKECFKQQVPKAVIGERRSERSFLIGFHVCFGYLDSTAVANLERHLAERAVSPSSNPLASATMSVPKG